MTKQTKTDNFGWILFLIGIIVILLALVCHSDETIRWQEMQINTMREVIIYNHNGWDMCSKDIVPKGEYLIRYYPGVDFCLYKRIEQ